MKANSITQTLLGIIVNKYQVLALSYGNSRLKPTGLYGSNEQIVCTVWVC